MRTFSCDSNRCVPCTVCEKTCPKKLVEVSDGKAAVTESFPEKCNGCLHCVAFCPMDAIVHSDAPGVSREGYKARSEDAERIASLLKTRRSIRAFRRDGVSPETIEAIMEAVKYAPTGANRREFRWVITGTPQSTAEVTALLRDWWKTEAVKEGDDPSKIAFMFERLEAGIDTITGGAPHIAFCVVTKETKWDAVDTGIALTYFNVMCEALGLGCLFSANSARAAVGKPVRERLGLKESETCLCAICFGKPVYRPKRIPGMAKAPVTIV